MLLDIHIPLILSLNNTQSSVINPGSVSRELNRLTNSDDCVLSESLRWNSVLKNENKDEERIDFTSMHMPHITLFIADFDIEQEHQLHTVNQTKLDELVNSIDSQIQKFSTEAPSSCNLQFFDPIVNYSGSYVMLRIEKYECLQYYSDSIVNATKRYVNKNSTIPVWVKDLPEPSKQNLINNIKKYGSPNVFEAFDPHVTVAYYNNIVESQKRMDLEDVIHKLEDSSKSSCTQIAKSIALGFSSVGGSVLRGPIHEKVIHQ